MKHDTGLNGLNRFTGVTAALLKNNFVPAFFIADLKKVCGY